MYLKVFSSTRQIGLGKIIISTISIYGIFAAAKSAKRKERIWPCRLPSGDQNLFPSNHMHVSKIETKIKGPKYHCQKQIIPIRFQSNHRDFNAPCESHKIGETTLSNYGGRRQVSKPAASATTYGASHPILYSLSFILTNG